MPAASDEYKRMVTRILCKLMNICDRLDELDWTEGLLDHVFPEDESRAPTLDEIDHAVTRLGRAIGATEHIG